MSILHSQLAIYGAIDDLVVQARKGAASTDQAVLATAEKLLPNTTGFGEAGWYGELEQFINRDGIRSADETEHLRFPSLDDAVLELVKVPPPNTDENVNHPRDPDTDGGFESQTFYDSANDPVLARAAYGVFALLKLGDVVEWRGFEADTRAALRDVLAVAVRSFVAPGDPGKVTTLTDGILGGLETTNTREGWTKLVAGVSPQFAADSKPCFGSLQEINGQYCSTVVTNSYSPALSVADIEVIVDPMNWSLCSKFFCKMRQNTPNRNHEHWSRVQEQIGAECGKYRLITDLIFYKVRQPDGSIFMNYDIDPQRKDPGYVKVDNGYIYISPDKPGNDATKKGVRIRTSKQERVDGLSPCATAALACLMGWADAAKEMLAGTAQRIIDAKKAGKPVPKLKKFYPSNEDDPEERK